MINANEINKGRDVIYNFLSRSLWDIPDSSYLNMFKDLHLDIIEMMKNNNESELQTAGEILESFSRDKLLQNDKNRNDIILELSKEYTKLFYLGSHSVPICESAYLSPMRAYMQEPWEEVKKVYAENKFTPENKGNKPEDHISFELLFMAYLSQKASVESEQINENGLLEIYKIQLSFMEEHLLRWIDDLSEKILNLVTNENSLYAAIVLLLRGYLHEDYKFLREELEN